MQAETTGMDDTLSYTGTIFYSYGAVGTLDVGYGDTLGIKQAVSAGQTNARKHVSMVRPRFQTNMQDVIPKITINTDYDTTVPLAPPPSGTIAAGALWDVAQWDVDTWPTPTFFNTQTWVPTYAMSSILAPIVQVTLKTATTPDLRLTNIDVLFESGNIFG
jgi:hypothetical protein